jgi:hypothetical protein
MLSNSPGARIMRDAENIIALALDMNEDLEVIIAFLRQHAGPEWTQLALERALNARRTGAKLKEHVTEFHPYKAEPTAVDGGQE